MIIIGNRKLTVGDFFKVLFEGEKVDIDIESRQKVAEDLDIYHFGYHGISTASIVYKLKEKI